MRESNYRFNCLPDPKRVTGSFAFTVDVRTDFINFAKTQQIDHATYEKEAITLLNSCGFSNTQIQAYQLDKRGIYHWNSESPGLLRLINLPGWEENYIEFVEKPFNWYLFGSHNIDTVEQFSSGFLLLNKWLRDIDLRMPK